jgi:hypothetical protein
LPVLDVEQPLLDVARALSAVGMNRSLNLPVATYGTSVPATTLMTRGSTSMDTSTGSVTVSVAEAPFASKVAVMIARPAFSAVARPLGPKDTLNLADVPAA